MPAKAVGEGFPRPLILLRRSLDFIAEQGDKAYTDYELMFALVAQEALRLLTKEAF